MKKFIIKAALIVFLAITGSVFLPGRSIAQVEERFLDNGAAIVARHIPGSEVTVVDLGILSGLSNEGEYAGSGISHFVEHLLFKEAHPHTDPVLERVRDIGGIINGFTGQDSAGYYITVPNENFEEALEILVELVMELDFTEEDFLKERQVIIREMNMHNDNPSRRLMDLLFSRAYMENIYRHPVIGYIDRFLELTEEDVRWYHQKTYSPDRVVLGIAGGVPLDRMLSAAEEHLSGYRRGDAWSVAVREEPRQMGQRRRDEAFNVDLAHMAIGFHTTNLFSEDVYPADVLAILLGSGRDSRLYSRLVRDKELLYSVSAGNMTPRYGGLFVIRGTGEPEKMDEAEKEIFAVIEELKREGAGEAELERARNLVSAGFLRSQERTHQIASSMTRSQLLTGSTDFHKMYVENVQEVRPEEVNDVLAKYLKEENSTVVRLMPTAFMEERLVAEAEKVPDTYPERVEMLPNGMKLIMKKRPHLPLVSVNLSFQGGLRAQSAEESGLSRLTASLMLKGTETRSEEDIVPAFERMGGSISSHSGRNSFGLSMSFLADDLDKAFDIFSDAVKNPNFPEGEIDKLKSKTIAAIREEDKRIFSRGSHALRELLYGDHPYHMRQLGEIETVEAIKREDIVRFHESFARPSGAVLTVVGDIDEDEVLNKLSQVFADLRGEARDIEHKEVPLLVDVRTEELFMDREQALLLMAFQGVDMNDPRRYPLSVLASMLSGGGGILFGTVREEHGLAYSIGASSLASVDKGYFLVYVKTTEEDLLKAKEKTLEVLKDIRKGGFTERELDSGKNRLLTSFATSRETNSALAGMMARHELVGLGYDYHKAFPDRIREVTRKSVIEAAQEILDLDRYAEVVVYPEEDE